MNFKPMASLLLLSVVSSSYAEVIFKKGKWGLDDKSLDRGGSNVCNAYVAEGDYFLVISREKNKPGSAEVFIQRSKNKGASSFKIRLRNGKVLSFANAGRNEKNHDVMWNIPQNTQALIEQLVADKNVKIIPADGSGDKEREFSANGFDKVMVEMQKRCINNRELVDSAFEKSFLIRQDEINPVGVSLSNITEMKRLLKSAYPVHMNILGNEDQMNKLRLKFKVQLDEASSLSTLIEKLGSRDIPANIKATQDNDALEVAKKSELKEVTQAIVTQTASAKASEKVYNSAKAAIAPFEDEHDRREGSLNQAQSRVNQGSSRIEQLNNGIAGARSQINTLNQELGSLTESSRRAQFDLRTAKGELVRADQNYRRFDPKIEMGRLLQVDRNYNEAVKELSALQPHYSSLERAHADMRSKVIAREAELRACLSKPVSMLTAFELLRLPAQVRPEQPGRERPNREERPNRPERPDRPNKPEADDKPTTPPTSPTPSTPTPTPSTPTPTTSTPTPAPTTDTTPAPAPECTSQKEAVRIAKAAEDDVESQMRSVRNRIESAKDRRNAAQNHVVNVVQREQHQLEQELRVASNRVDQIQNVLVANESRIARITNNDLPQLEMNIRSQQNELSQVTDQYNQDVQQASRLNQELQSFEAQVGWDQKLSALHRAVDDLNARRSALERSLTIKQNAETTIANCQSQRVRLGNELVAKQQQKAQAETRLVEVQASLLPFDADKAKIEGEGGNLKNQLAGLSLEFEGQLPK